MRYIFSVLGSSRSRAQQGDEPLVVSAKQHSELQGALHDVANALTVVLGWLDVAQRNGQCDEPAKRALALAHERAVHGQLIARTAIGASCVDPMCDRVARLTRNAILGVEPSASERGVSLDVRIEDAAVAQQVHSSTWVLQILTNLLMNAVAFSSPGQSVELLATASGAFVCFRVSDAGPGIAPELKPRIFAGGVTTRAGGAGIGLRHAKELALRAGATLELVDQQLGSCFELKWPVFVDDLAVSISVERSSSSLAGHSVLIIEDDPAIVSLLELALGTRGASVRVASNITQLRDVLMRGPFDSALVDLSPIEHAPRLELDKLRAVYPDLRVVIISGSAKGPSQDVLDCASAWIRKPFDVAEIVSALLAPTSAIAAQ